MADESNLLPASRLVRWMALGAVILFAVGLYFRWGARVPPVSATAAPVVPEPAGSSPTTR
jgi:hypothetical protein